MPTTIIKCGRCVPHEFQDRIYGEQMRVHNLGGRKLGSVKAVCTVCSNITSITIAERKEADESNSDR